MDVTNCKQKNEHLNIHTNSVEFLCVNWKIYGAELLAENKHSCINSMSQKVEKLFPDFLLVETSVEFQPIF